MIEVQLTLKFEGSKQSLKYQATRLSRLIEKELMTELSTPSRLIIHQTFEITKHEPDS